MAHMSISQIRIGNCQRFVRHLFFRSFIFLVSSFGVLPWAEAQWCNSPNPQFCPGNLFQNGDFETVTGHPDNVLPFGDDLSLATGWQDMWSSWGGGTLSDIFCNPSSNKVGSNPIPNTGVHAGFWLQNKVNDTSNPLYREGIYNKLLSTIAKNSGSYSINFKLSLDKLTCQNPGNPVRIGVYGVYNPNNTIAPKPTNNHIPSNLDIWPNSSGVVVVLLGTITPPHPYVTSSLNWVPQTVTFNSSILPANGITHIMITADDTFRPSNPGAIMAYFDEFCVQGKTFCCPGVPGPQPINYTAYGHPDYPTAICPCNDNVISTTKCPNATYLWSVSPSTVTFSGQGTDQITLNGSSFGANVSSITMTLTVTCSTVAYTSTKTIPVLNGCNTAGTPTINISYSSGNTGVLNANATCANFGQGWTLKAWDLPHNVNCSQFESGPIVAQGTGNTFNYNNIQTGKYYRLAYYVERCSKTWKNQCAKVKYICFTIYPSSARMPSQFAGGKTKSLGKGMNLVFFETE